jgi:ABC-type bacteriocin/lantibiotic exporter with double-glycine peptidase domain
MVATRLLTKKFDGRVEIVFSSTYALDNVFEQVNKIIKGAFLKSSYQLAIHQTTEKIKIFALEKRAIKTRTKAYDKQQNPDFSTVHNKFLDLSKVLK